MSPLDERAIGRALAAEGAAALVLVVQPDDDWRCVFVSAGSHRLLGRESPELEGRPLFDMVHPEDAGRLNDAMAQAVASGEPAHLSVRLSGRAGSWVECPLRLQCGASGAWTGLVLAVHHGGPGEQGAVQVVPGYTDSLTGAASRSLLLDRTRQALARLERSEDLVGLLFLDLDHFKRVNDTLGHHAGDEVLRAFKERVAGLLRPSDTFARLGGDEFAVLVGDLRGKEQALSLAERIAHVGRLPYMVEGREVVCSVSVGVAVTNDASEPVSTLLRQADTAMYRAKWSGRGRSRSYTDEDGERARARIDTERLLRRAIARGRMQLEYQPVVWLEQECLAGAEGLVRVVDEEGRQVRPEAFLDVALATRLIEPIDAWVLGTATSERARVGPTTDEFVISLNLSAYALEDGRLPGRLLGALADCGMAPSSLQLDVSEGVLLGASGAALDRLQALRDSGVRVGVDNFGAGATSLAALWEFPVDCVKVDRTVTRQLPMVRAARSLLRAIVEMAHGVGLVVVAQGIETGEQRLLAVLAGCDQGEGHLWRSESTLAALAPDLWRASSNGHVPSR
jgi:diguanylate cyclase (GGDEF)-like protein